jgi:hypothetical protein
MVLILTLRGEIQALKLRHVSTTTVKVIDGETDASSMQSRSSKRVIGAYIF